MQQMCKKMPTFVIKSSFKLAFSVILPSHSPPWIPYALKQTILENYWDILKKLLKNSNKISEKLEGGLQT